MTNWLKSHGNIQGPVCVQSVLERFPTYASFSCPSAKTLSLSSPGEISIRGKILRLFHSGSPSTIFLGITYVPVDAFDRMFRGRPFPHVLNKTFEFLPSFTNLNALGSIVRIIGMVFILAALLHLVPHFINRIEVSSVGFFKGLSIATARFDASLFKPPGFSNFFIPTVALAKPFAALNIIENDQSSETNSLHEVS